MAGLSVSPEDRGQFSAIASFVGSSSSILCARLAAGLEVVSRLFIALGFAAVGFGGAFGLGSRRMVFLSPSEQTEWLAVLLWPVFMFWQLFPRPCHCLHRKFRLLESPALSSHLQIIFFHSRRVWIARPVDGNGQLVAGRNDDRHRLALAAPIAFRRSCASRYSRFSTSCWRA